MARRAAMEWPDVWKAICSLDFVSAMISRNRLASSVFEVISISRSMENAVSCSSYSALL